MQIPAFCALLARSQRAGEEMMRLNMSRANNFGVLRLLFAYLVIVAHSPELVDGNASRELLTQIFGTITFGGLAVDVRGHSRHFLE